MSVSNTGERSGDEVVQLYVRDVQGSVTRPVAQLVGYARVSLEPGETKTVEFTVPPTRLAFTARDMRRVVEPGEFVFWTGTSARPAHEAVSVNLTGSVHPIALTDERVIAVTHS